MISRPSIRVIDRCTSGLFGSYLALSLLLYSVTVLRSLKGLYLFDGDTEWFFPVVYNYHYSGNLSHPFWNKAPDAQAFWHGYMMPVLFDYIWSALPLRYENISIIGLILVFLNASLAAFLGRSRSTRIYLAALGFGIGLYQIGRPELVATTFVLILLSVLSAVRADIKSRAILFGVFYGFSFASSPAVSVLFGSYHGTRILLERKETFKHSGLTFVTISTVSALATLCILPIVLNLDFDVIEWIKALAIHGEEQLERFSLHNAYFYFVRPIGPIVAGPMLIYLYHAFYRKFDVICSYILLGLILFLMFASSLMVPERVYYFVAWAFLWRVGLECAYPDEQSKHGIFYGDLIVASANVVAALFIATQSMLTLLYGVPAAEVRQVAREMIHGPSKSVLAPPSFAIIIKEEAPNSEVRGVAKQNIIAQTTSDTLGMVPQGNNAAIAQKASNACRTMISALHQRGPHLLGFPVGRTYKDWAFVLVTDCKSTHDRSDKT